MHETTADMLYTFLCRGESTDVPFLQRISHITSNYIKAGRSIDEIPVGVQFINYYFEKAVLECFLGILFFLAVCIILRYSAGSLEKIEQIYSLSDAKLFRFLIGFMLT